MKAYRLRGTGSDRTLVLEDRSAPLPKPGYVRVRVRAASFNYRDLLVLDGGYARNDLDDVVPLSDGAGEISALGDGVSGWNVGDRVVINFMAHWSGGPIDDRALNSSLGGGVDGVLAEEVCVPAHALVALPDGLGFAEAASLPCAAVTAWHGLRRCGVKAGDKVLLLGTGGVSVFALQFAKAMGAEVTITSSSEEKLAMMKELGADHVVNYRTHPEWDEVVRELTGGVDAVVETGGSGTLARSMAACRPGGQIALIGVLTSDTPDVTPILLNALTVHGIYVGSTEMLREVVEAVHVNRIEPVIDRRFAFSDAEAAYVYLRSGQHVGKVVIEV
ncbi:zinc-dependent alcohol dehydrogenase family protein [Parvularcula maris]|uniref:NAD(P)-dependent alcohol dehydrogenase n=1 Tax=Parvularcula maris TaxID=2965077 RepID=A0A9X2L694_9PROT|nr:NAD(P)-dependent alcohol dehydrogenase [Parvularcula maris]MCQ8183848.1 NAD(P)-dependent alcohol dehydrogenase [Parvularcula maris]